MPLSYDAAATRQYRLDIFMHGRDDTVLEQQFMAKSTTGYTSKPLGAGADRFMLQPYGRYTNASRFAGEIDGLEAIESVAKAYPIDRNRIVMTGFSMGGASAWSYLVHFADRWAAAAPGAGFTETEVFLRGELARQPQNAVQQNAVAPVRLDRLRDQHVQRAGRGVLGRHRRPEAGRRRDGRGDDGGRADARARHRSEHRRTRTSPARGSRCRIAWIELAATGRNPAPKEIRFTTWTLRYNRMFWMTVDAHGRALGARPRRREDRRRHDPHDHRERDGAAPRVRARARAVRRRRQSRR